MLRPGLRHEIAGVSVSDLVEKFATPTYVYDASLIMSRVADLRSFDVIRYAQKANSNLAILDWVRRQGVLVDAVSAGEIYRALEAGYPLDRDPPSIVYTADVFDAESLDLIVKSNIPVNCGSPDMIRQYGELCPGQRVTLRINPGFGSGHSQKTNTGGELSKHGIWHEDIDSALKESERYGLKITGLHIHIGSGGALDALPRVIDAMESVAMRVGPSIEMMSAGGGIPVAERSGEVGADLDHMFVSWDKMRRRIERSFSHAVRLEVEPGRYLVAESGYLLTEIRAIKQMGRNTFYLVDAGFNTLARPALYGSYHPMSLVPSSEEERPDMDVIVGGPLCESGDVFTQHVDGTARSERLAQARVGEVLVIERVGAYGFAMASNYNSKPYPAEVMIVEGTPYLTRERQSSRELMRGERVLPK